MARYLVTNLKTWKERDIIILLCGFSNKQSKYIIRDGYEYLADVFANIEPYLNVIMIKVQCITEDVISTNNLQTLDLDASFIIGPDVLFKHGFNTRLENYMDDKIINITSEKGFLILTVVRVGNKQYKLITSPYSWNKL